MRRTGKLLFILLMLTGTIFASDSLTVYGRIIDTSGVGVADAKIITEDGVVAYTEENGTYVINISKDYVPIDRQEIVVNPISDYSVKIYNLLGQKIFDEAYHQSDFTQFAWKGLNKRGELASSGIYFSILEMNDQMISRNKITIVGQEVLNKRPFVNASIQKINIPYLSKVSDYTYDTKLSLEGENFTNISDYRLRIEYNGNNDNAAEAEDIVLSTYEIDYIYDIDQNRYKVVKIGDQWWMAENLKVTRYRNGESISDCWAYSNDESNVSTYGRLYSWYAVSDSRNIAPEGWHVPTDDEWEELAQYISDDNGGYSKRSWYLENVGRHLKSTSNWYNSGNGTDDYGFAGLPAGYRYLNGSFYTIGLYAYFWSASEHDTDLAWYRLLYYSYSAVNRLVYYKRCGFGVRCVRD